MKRDLRGRPGDKGSPFVCNVAAAIIGSAVVGGAVAAHGSKQAAKAQVEAGRQAQATQQQALDSQLAIFERTRNDLTPFRQGGEVALSQLMAALKPGGALSKGLPEFKPFALTQQQLEATPGYQFNLSQGLKAVQNSAAARGLGVSGAAQKGAARFATGLADTTFGNQLQRHIDQFTTGFNAAATNQNNLFNRLIETSRLGSNAAAQTGAFGTQTGSQLGEASRGIAGAQQGVGNAQAGGIVGGANAISGAASSVPNALLLSNLLGGGGLFGKKG